jgi:hypothetical protein
MKDIYKALAEKSQLLRFFHERTIAELKAMKKAFEQAQARRKP